MSERACAALPVLSAVLRALLRTLPPAALLALLPALPAALSPVLLSHLPAPLLRPVRSGAPADAQIGREPFSSCSHLLRLLLAQQSPEPRLAYWPLRAIVSLVSEQAQPSLCRELALLARQIISLVAPAPASAPHSRLLALCGQALLCSLRYCETADLCEVLAGLAADPLPRPVAWKILAILPFLRCFEVRAAVHGRLTRPAQPSLSSHVLERLLLLLARPDPRADPLERVSVQGWRCAETFLRFAPDLSVFERPSLAPLQATIIAFLQRQDGGPLDAPLLASTVATLDPILARPAPPCPAPSIPLPAATRIAIPALAPAPTDAGIALLISQLQACLSAVKGTARHAKTVSAIRESLEM